MKKERNIDRINRIFWELRQQGKLDKPAVKVVELPKPKTRARKRKSAQDGPRCCRLLWPEKLPQSFRDCPDCPLTNGSGESKV